MYQMESKNWLDVPPIPVGHGLVLGIPAKFSREGACRSPGFPPRFPGLVPSLGVPPVPAGPRAPSLSPEVNRSGSVSWISAAISREGFIATRPSVPRGPPVSLEAEGACGPGPRDPCCYFPGRSRCKTFLWSPLGHGASGPSPEARSVVGPWVPRRDFPGGSRPQTSLWSPMGSWPPGRNL